VNNRRCAQREKQFRIEDDGTGRGFTDADLLDDFGPRGKGYMQWHPGCASRDGHSRSAQSSQEESERREKKWVGGNKEGDARGAGRNRLKRTEFYSSKKGPAGIRKARFIEQPVMTPLGAREGRGTTGRSR